MDSGGIALLYIKKFQPTKEVADEISRVKRDCQFHSARDMFDSLDKSFIRASLIAEQHGLCAYCMRRIRNDTNMTIEHWRPIDIDENGALDYDNMLGVCDGGRRAGTMVETPHVLCCDASKGDRAITINPCNLEHMSKIRYSTDGHIYTYPRDEILEKDINEVLHLNGEKGLDTSTRLLRSRREAYRAYESFIGSLSRSKKLSRSVIEKKIRHIENQETYDELAGVILYFLKRKLKQL